MANVVTINRPDVVAQIDEAARKLTRGNKTEAVALAIKRLLDEDARAGSLFGAHRGSVKVRDGSTSPPQFSTSSRTLRLAGSRAVSARLLLDTHIVL